MNATTSTHRKTTTGWLFVSLVAIAAPSAMGQDFTAYTRVYDMGAVRAAESDTAHESTDDAPLVSESYSMFHAGKAYDYIEAMDEVIIVDFDSSRQRFTLLSPRRELSTVIYFDELKHFEKLAENETQTYLDELRKKESPHLAQVLSMHAFQRRPRFDESYDEHSGQLTLSSEFIRYEVRCSTKVQPENVKAYIRYADSICSLNYVLHPGVLQPQPRLALNKSLQKIEAIPTRVELRANLPHRLHLRAEHKFDWNLDNRDRNLIDTWESKLAGKSMRRVTPREYQRKMLVAGSNKSR